MSGRRSDRATVMSPPIRSPPRQQESSPTMTIHHTPTASPVLPYYLGCPVWACPGYVGKVIAPGAKRHEYLHQYSIAFNTVEGNRTFYGLPTLDTARRWATPRLSETHFADSAAVRRSGLGHLLFGRVAGAGALELTHILTMFARVSSECRLGLTCLVASGCVC